MPRGLSCLAFLAGLAACERIPGQGSCDPGYLEVDGRCELAVGQACQRDADCLARVCASGEDGLRFCTISCGEDADCPAEFYCATWADRRCYPGARPPACRVAADCDPCQRCEQGRCLREPDCQTCVQDGECGACGRCEAGECLQVAGCRICQTDSTCATCELCLEGRCQRQGGCVLCQGDPDCPGCTRCDRGGCVPIPGCGTDPCFNDLDCPSRTRCLQDRVSGLRVCLPIGLAYGQDCTRGGDAACLEGLCLVGSDLAWRCSRGCLDPAECPPGAVCAPDAACLFACRAPDPGPPPGTTCQADRDCPAGRVCGLVAALDGRSWQTRCLVPLVCAGAAGESCAPEDPRRGRCQSGVCSSLGHCTSVCLGDFDCPPGSACAWLLATLPASGEEAAYRGCAAWGSGLAELGEPCPGGAGECRSGSCLRPASGGHEVCSTTCEPGLAQCPDSMACLAAPDDPQAHVCLPQTLAGCQADAECQAGELCRLAGGGLVCGPPDPAGRALGEPCLVGAECLTGLCTDEGLCASACRAAADCPGGLVCDTRAVRLPAGGMVPVAGCGPAAGSLQACRTGDECPGGEVCALWPTPWGAGFQARCRPSPPGGAEVGAACEAPARCASGVCSQDGLCSQVCLEDAGCPLHFACRAVLAADPSGATHFLQGCAPRNAGLGEPCPDGDLDCLSGLCHLPEPPGSGEPYCSRACAAAEDCAEGAGMLCTASLEPRICVWP